MLTPYIVKRKMLTSFIGIIMIELCQVVACSKATTRNGGEIINFIKNIRRVLVFHILKAQHYPQSKKAGPGASARNCHAQVEVLILPLPQLWGFILG